jgi:hypothetical protein
VSFTSARHRKPSQPSSSAPASHGGHAGPPPGAPASHSAPAGPPSSAPASHSAQARHRKRSPLTAALCKRPAQIGVAATVGAAVLAAPAAQALGHLSGSARPEAMYQAGSGTLAAGLRDQVASPSPAPSRSPEPTPTPTPSRAAPSSVPVTHAAPASTQQAVYSNPLRDVSGLIPERVDQGVDFGGSGPVYALGNAVITNATDESAGWPGGGWITYQLTSGPASGLEVYMAEDVQPTVSVGQQVTSSTVIANMFNGGAGIETGWAEPGGESAESQLPEAGGINGNGPFPTEVGLNFEGLLEGLGVPAGPNASEQGNGILPSGYPAS